MPSGALAHSRHPFPQNTLHIHALRPEQLLSTETRPLLRYAQRSAGAGTFALCFLNIEIPEEMHSWALGATLLNAITQQCVCNVKKRFVPGVEGKSAKSCSVVQDSMTSYRMCHKTWTSAVSSVRQRADFPQWPLLLQQKQIP